MIKKIVATPFIIVFTPLLLILTYVTRLFSMLCVLVACVLSYFISFFNSPELFKIVSSVLAFGELSCIINKDKPEERNEEEIRSK